ncbi:MAG: iron-containing alcohol dehydrogenase [Anaerolineae bacterium]|nr:iron-containing alcohol dehydrogenase [Anaerolineae bacterium]
MWQFKSPFIVFGEDALDYLDSVRARQFFIVTDANMVRLGLVDAITRRLNAPYAVFDGVEPEPSLQTIRLAAAAMTEAQPDWIIGLGGGSCMDAAKATWLLYEKPDADIVCINPMEHYGVGSKAKLIAIPTTSGTGSEATLATVLTDTDEHRKLSLGSYEIVPNIAIVDPALVIKLPPVTTADTGMDVLGHAIEGYTSRMHNDFSDAMCLRALELVLEYLPRAYADGSDIEARTHMHNAAAMGGLGFGNSQTALAHAMGHAFGALFKMAHGRAVSLFLPYTIEYTANGGGTRYADIAERMKLNAASETKAAFAVADRVRELERALDMPTNMQQAGVTHDRFTAALAQLVANANMDTQLVMNMRVPETPELEKLFEYAFDGRHIDF